MSFYPEYFGKAVENSSEIYNYYEWNTKNRASAAQHVKADTREQPKLTQPIEGRDLVLGHPLTEIFAEDAEGGPLADPIEGHGLGRLQRTVIGREPLPPYQPGDDDL